MPSSTYCRDDLSPNTKDPLEALSRPTSDQISLDSYVTAGEKDPEERDNMYLETAGFSDSSQSPWDLYTELAGASNDPPAMSSILKAITAQPRAVESPCWTEYQLDACHVDLLRQRLEECGVSEKVRSGYFSELGIFVHEAHSYTHSIYACHFSRYFFKKLDHLSSSPEEEACVAHIVDSGSSDAKAKDSTNKDYHQPDNFYSHFFSIHHGCCLEIACTQKRARLNDLAEFYFFDSDRQTQVLVCIDFDADRSKKATLLTWRRSGGKLTAHVQDIRTEDGKLVPGDSLRITMLEIAPPDRIPPSMHNMAIEFSVQELVEILELAESARAKWDEIQRAKNTVPIVPKPTAWLPDGVEGASKPNS
ncbi:hypothetical protein Z517_09014 [Fonsecaea pedrosoi CBS 271.37]|uniref:Uncharacterized protein n=1 Tax=Fonsecaea pedrosoi CBS 271.37 TaxID=1442368 RepID=A0A0D2GD18_9EURO|nr:uncharacterized protein Z517_09014 [Fonsecaea pedrosoi CBS 271.37]KIW76570.1 hypothetical protein Z517_09014 [Fonsecaea pedrosoi CBS 271.37]